MGAYRRVHDSPYHSLICIPATVGIFKTRQSGIVGSILSKIKIRRRWPHPVGLQPSTCNTEQTHDQKSFVNHDNDIVKKLVDYPNRIRLFNDELAASENSFKKKSCSGL